MCTANRFLFVALLPLIPPLACTADDSGAVSNSEVGGAADASSTADGQVPEDPLAQPDSGGATGSDATADAEPRQDFTPTDLVDDETAPDLGAPPGELPLIQIDALQYQGAFRLPAAQYGASEMSYSEGPLAIDPETRSLFIVGHSHHQAIAEFTLPDLVNSDEVGELDIAPAPLQAFSTLLNRIENPQDINRIGGMALVGGPSGPELLINAYEYYDAPGDNSHTTLVLRDPDDLAAGRVDGFYSLNGVAHASGWISPIPPEWQTTLGGTHITGSSSGMPIISRLSVGPSAFVFDPLDIVGSDAPPGDVSTTALLDFDLEHPLHGDLSNDSGDNDVWTHLSRAVYGFIVPGTRTYLTLGYSGGHESGVCYKCTPSDGSNCGGYCAYDADDYVTYYWLWDVADLVAVREQRLQPHEVRPYDYGQLEIPFRSNQLGGGSWDPIDELLYLTIQRADREQGTYANPPVVAAFAYPDGRTARRSR